jgi:hypothetical protein
MSRVNKQLAVLPSGPLWHSNRFGVIERGLDPTEEWYFAYRLGHRNQHECCGNFCTDVPSGGNIRNFVLLRTYTGAVILKYFGTVLLNALCTLRTTTIMKNIEFRSIFQELFCVVLKYTASEV